MTDAGARFGHSGVRGFCPACGNESLFLGSGGYVTCSLIGCPRPDAATDILGDRETEHLVQLGPKTFTVRHPLRERLDDDLLRCVLHDQIRTMSGPPRRAGMYRVRAVADGWSWEPLAVAS